MKHTKAMSQTCNKLPQKVNLQKGKFQILTRFRFLDSTNPLNIKSCNDNGSMAWEALTLHTSIPNTCYISSCQHAIYFKQLSAALYMTLKCSNK
jgi:hypothetical protein